MPFVYFSKAATDTASVTVNAGTVAVDEETLLITGSQGGANFAVYAPTGSAWIQSGSTYTSSLAGENYWSMAFLPDGPPATLAAAWQEYAYVEPTTTEVSWSYDESHATLRTEFTTTVEVHEGVGTSVLQGLLPHQWAHLAPDAPALSGQWLPSIRGEVKLIATVKERLEDWLSAESGEVAFLFYYQPTWTTLLGYPAGHGQDTNINDHHFHWGSVIGDDVIRDRSLDGNHRQHRHSEPHGE